MKNVLKFNEFTNESFELNEADESVNEGIGTIALGIMLAWAGLKVIKVVAKKIIGKIAFNAELKPEMLKSIVDETTKKVSAQTGTSQSILLTSLLKIELDKRIDAGELKTVNDVNNAMEDYIKSNEK